MKDLMIINNNQTEKTMKNQIQQQNTFQRVGKKIETQIREQQHLEKQENNDTDLFNQPFPKVKYNKKSSLPDAVNIYSQSTSSRSKGKTALSMKQIRQVSNSSSVVDSNDVYSSTMNPSTQPLSISQSSSFSLENILARARVIKLTDNDEDNTQQQMNQKLHTTQSFSNLATHTNQPIHNQINQRNNISSTKLVSTSNKKRNLETTNKSNSGKFLTQSNSKRIYNFID